MKITIKLGGHLRQHVQGHECGLMTITLPENAVISQALDTLHLKPGDVRVIMKNGLAIKSDEPLKDGDRLGLFPPELAYNTMTAISFFNPLARKNEESD